MYIKKNSFAEDDAVVLAAIVLEEANIKSKYHSAQGSVGYKQSTVSWI